MATLSCLALTVALLAACGPSNTVRLLPPPSLEASMLPPANAPRLSVVLFADGREDRTALGVRRDGSAFEADGSLAQWVSNALAEALAHTGLQVSFATTVNEARKGNPDYLLTGELQEIWLRETSTTDITATMRIQYTLASREKKVLPRDSFSASQSRSGLPSKSKAEQLLLDTLNDLVNPTADKIFKTVTKGK
jgi:uncharacterized lipoprotein YajG